MGGSYVVDNWNVNFNEFINDLYTHITNNNNSNCSKCNVKFLWPEKYYDEKNNTIINMPTHYDLSYTMLLYM